MNNSELINEVDQEIAEIGAMIDHFILISNREEIAYWRRMLQHAKIYKRSLKTS